MPHLFTIRGHPMLRGYAADGNVKATSGRSRNGHGKIMLVKIEALAAKSVINVAVAGASAVQVADVASGGSVDMPTFLFGAAGAAIAGLFALEEEATREPKKSWPVICLRLAITISGGTLFAMAGGAAALELVAPVEGVEKFGVILGAFMAGFFGENILRVMRNRLSRGA